MRDSSAPFADGDPPLVSVVIPAFNRARTIAASVRSVLGQTYEPLETIVVDDCSSDGTLDALERISDPRLRIVALNANGGAGHARNVGIGAARGELIAFHDSDDLWLPDKLTRQVATMRRLGGDYVALYSGKILYGKAPDGRYGPGTAKFVPEPGVHDPSDSVLGSLAGGNHLTVQSALIRAEALDGLRFDATLRCNEDWDFALKLAQRGKIAYDPGPDCLAVISDDSISRHRHRNALTILAILRRNREVFARYPQARARHLYTVARYLARRGRVRGSTRLLGAARRCDPRRARIYAALLTNALAARTPKGAGRGRATGRPREAA
jgi:glycosyltransferase involved in cell wall biosynthesis